MGTVTPQNITLSNMNVVGADEIRVEEKMVLYQKHFCICTNRTILLCLCHYSEKRNCMMHIFPELQRALQTIK